MARQTMDICLRVLKESNKSRFNSYSVRNSVLLISHITFRDCRVHIFPTTFLEIVVSVSFVTSVYSVRISLPFYIFHRILIVIPGTSLHRVSLYREDRVFLKRRPKNEDLRPKTLWTKTNTPGD